MPKHPPSFWLQGLGFFPAAAMLVACGTMPGTAAAPTLGLTAARNQKFNYELFNCNNFNIRYWSWNYRGCWHQTCPPIAFGKVCKLSSLHF